MPGKNAFYRAEQRRGVVSTNVSLGLFGLYEFFQSIISEQPHSPQNYLFSNIQPKVWDGFCLSIKYNVLDFGDEYFLCNGKGMDTMTIIRRKILTHFTYFEFLIFNYSLANIRHVLLIKDFVCTKFSLIFASVVGVIRTSLNITKLVQISNPIFYPWWQFPDSLSIRFIEGQNHSQISDNWIPLSEK